MCHKNLLKSNSKLITCTYIHEGSEKLEVYRGFEPSSFVQPPPIVLFVGTLPLFKCNSFILQIVFQEESAAGLDQWFVKNFQHRNLSAGNDTENDVIYQYGGFEDSVWAPKDLSYRCST